MMAMFWAWAKIFLNAAKSKDRHPNINSFQKIHKMTVMDAWFPFRKSPYECVKLQKVYLNWAGPFVYHSAVSSGGHTSVDIWGPYRWVVAQSLYFKCLEGKNCTVMAATTNTSLCLACIYWWFPLLTIQARKVSMFMWIKHKLQVDKTACGPSGNAFKTQVNAVISLPLNIWAL